METIIINKNEENQRLDRFLKKYLRNAPLSHVYKIIRKDVKVNGKRVKEDYVLMALDRVDLYIKEEDLAQVKSRKDIRETKTGVSIAYEDENILIAIKPKGLLTHGTALEKKETLANSVINYLIQKEEYVPRIEKTFSPAPANRLDRNTTGLVMFGKNAEALRELNRLLKERGKIRRIYLTVVKGEMKEERTLTGYLSKDERRNVVSVSKRDGANREEAILKVTPLACNKGFSLVEAELVSGRTHQIRAQLSKEGFPVIGDIKYGDLKVNRDMKNTFSLQDQLLHSRRLEFQGIEGSLSYLNGNAVLAPLPMEFQEIKEKLFKDKV
ncbi:MAG: RluA family pseudouridine synthase [Anaerovoracaceae bacterium]